MVVYGRRNEIKIILLIIGVVTDVNVEKEFMKVINHVFALIIGAVGWYLLFDVTDWKICLALFLIIWANNIATGEK